MNDPEVVFSFVDGIARITLNRPQRLNSLNDGMHEAIAAAIASVEHDPALRVLVLSGIGRAFCAGQDQTDRVPVADGEQRDLGASLEKYYKPLVLRLRALPVPVVCALNGLAAGVGSTLALACDIVIATKSAYFLQGFTKLGLLPDAGATQFLPQLIGPARAIGLSMLNDKLSAEQAAEWGLIWRCVDDAAFEEETQKIIDQLACSATKALGLSKLAIYAAAGNSLEQQLELEQKLQRALGYSDDYKEGVAAFREKRAPVFVGR
ncbi:enoyl-CoA hydratase-related protein [Herbaspirillum sp. RTI4]|uniref:enoyl-CoA hydratase-related protein n=1 Tax=Herbaspirillum sp. RTI4 TaxID=3048640 RepID=UPI002AB4FCEC|nr:enoyl-CoA hydratase-related protein [Herbaspirillum sp. RTI4]MDY7579748.1 enoyl-CoA hydratase-related protein [Herbaspirillum sp. RTI4]MEA9982722.1 2-(1,2-epoxy-1,2-dihydrophenyl)acetyl-CoA isomerase PaaG [Herbaspirillum sp. RTI4]